MWLGWLGVVPQSGRLPVLLQVRARAWAAGSVPGQGVCKRQVVDVSHIDVSPLKIKIKNKYNKIFTLIFCVLYFFNVDF